MAERTHNEFSTDAFVSIPLDESDRSWTIDITMPKEIVEQFRATPQPLQFHMCSTGSGPVGKPNEQHYISLLRSDWNERQTPSVVNEREQLRQMLSTVIDANYGTSYHHIGDGDGIPEIQAKEIADWWRAELERIQREYHEQKGGG